MATDVFSRTIAYGGAFAADATTVTFSDITPTAGMLAQEISWTYSQDVQRVYEVGSSYVYVVAGRTKGSVTMQRIMGPTRLALSFYTTYGNVCNISTNTMTMTSRASCPSTVTGNLFTAQLNGCVITSLSGRVQAQNMIVGEGLELMFLWLIYT